MGSIAAKASQFADPIRVSIMKYLLYRSGTVSQIAGDLGLSQSRVSMQLAKLREAGLVQVESRGRIRVYRTNTELVMPVLEVLNATDIRVTAETPTAAQHNTDDETLRHARGCYGHMGGTVAVDLLEGMIDRGWIVQDGDQPGLLQVTESGVAELEARRVSLTENHPNRRSLAIRCLDWSVQRPHLGGLLGERVLDALIHEGFIERLPKSRQMKVVRPIHKWLSAPPSGERTTSV